jgi:hypothetical protein
MGLIGSTCTALPGARDDDDGDEEDDAERRLPPPSRLEERLEEPEPRDMRTRYTMSKQSGTEGTL